MILCDHARAAGAHVAQTQSDRLTAGKRFRVGTPARPGAGRCGGQDGEEGDRGPKCIQILNGPDMCSFKAIKIKQLLISCFGCFPWLLGTCYW